jgi:hypothetical protein
VIVAEFVSGVPEEMFEIVVLATFVVNVASVEVPVPPMFVANAWKW